MANEHGHLPKADPPAARRRPAAPPRHLVREGLSRRQPVPDARARPAVLELFLSWVSFVYAGGSKLDPAMLELCRIRLASRNHCVH